MRDYDDYVILILGEEGAYDTFMYSREKIDKIVADNKDLVVRGKKYHITKEKAHTIKGWSPNKHWEWRLPWTLLFFLKWKFYHMRIGLLVYRENKTDVAVEPVTTKTDTGYSAVTPSFLRGIINCPLYRNNHKSLRFGGRNKGLIFCWITVGLGLILLVLFLTGKITI